MTLKTRRKRFWGYAIMGRDILDKNSCGLALPSFQAAVDEIRSIAPDASFSGVAIWSYVTDASDASEEGENGKL